MLIIDHLVIAALTLEEGIDHVRQALGVTVPQGGAHPLMATHNRLMKFDDGLFLEIIAPDPEAKSQRPRWFALDDPEVRATLSSSPRLITWVARALDLSNALASIPAPLGEIVNVSRGTLQWGSPCRLMAPCCSTAAFRRSFNGRRPSIPQLVWPISAAAFTPSR